MAKSTWTKPATTQKSYDVCVIGSQLGGVVAAALLSRRGVRVLHIDHDGLGSGYLDHGYFLPYAPAMIPSPRAFPAAEAALTELGLTADVLRTLEPCTPDLQLIMPKHRLDLPRDPVERSAEIRREWPEDAPRLEAMLAEILKLSEASTPFFKAMPPLPPRGFSERRAVSKAARGAVAGWGTLTSVINENLGGLGSAGRSPWSDLERHPFTRALAATQRFMGYLDSEPAQLAMARLVGSALRGTFRLAGGYDGLRELIRKRITEARGEVIGGDSGGAAIAESLEFDGGKVSGVKLMGSPHTFHARAVIVATDSAAIRRLIPPASVDRKLSALFDQVQPRYQLFTLNIVVKQKALPMGLGESALILRDPEGSASMENAVLLQTLPARRDAKKTAPELVPDERLLCAAGFVPVTSRDLGDTHQAELATRIRNAVAEVVPFFERHRVLESIPVLAAAQLPRGSRMLSHPLYEVAINRTLGVTGMPPRPSYKNLVFAGREVIPGLGIEGEFHAGVQAAAIVTGLLHHRDPLGRA